MQDKAKVIFSLQWLRALAASLVVARHVAVHSTGGDGPSFDVGQVGVDIFFVISGFVIYLTGRHLDWHVFARRRIARIVPLYWLATILAVVASISSAAQPMWLTNALSAFVFLPAHDSVRTIWPPVMAGWTLNFEMYFYTVCVLVLAVTPRRMFLPAISALIVAGIVLGAPALMRFGTTITPAPMILLLPISLEFIAGMLLARLWTAGVRTPLWVNAALMAGAVIALTYFTDSHPYRYTRAFEWGPPAIAIVWAFTASEERVRFDRWRLPLLLGDSSYALYLFHPIALSVGFAILRRIDLGLPFALEMSIGLLGCIAAGVLVHLYVEQRIVAWASGLLGLKRRTAPVALHSVKQGTTGQRLP